MSVPYSSGSDTTAIGMSDLELGKKAPSVTVTAVDTPERPVLGRRKTTGSINQAADHKLSYEGEEDALTKVGNFLWK